MSFSRDLDYDYNQNMQYDFEEITKGTIPLDDWAHMKLKTNLEEGKDYVLVGPLVWYVLGFMHRNKLTATHSACPVIRLFIVPTAPARENFLKTPYTGGYPDLQPDHLIFINKAKNRGFLAQPQQILVSLKATAKQLHKSFADLTHDQPLILRHSTGVTGFHIRHEETELPQSDDILQHFGLHRLSVLILGFASPHPPGQQSNPEASASKQSQNVTRAQLPPLQPQPKIPIQNVAFSQLLQDRTMQIRSVPRSGPGKHQNPNVSSPSGPKPPQPQQPPPLWDYLVLQEEIFENVNNDEDLKHLSSETAPKPLPPVVSKVSPSPAPPPPLNLDPPLEDPAQSVNRVAVPSVLHSISDPYNDKDKDCSSNPVHPHSRGPISVSAPVSVPTPAPEPEPEPRPKAKPDSESESEPKPKPKPTFGK
jgi:hypothetical protein